MKSFDQAKQDLTKILAQSERGPQRHSVYALWLFIRLCSDLFPPHPVGERGHRRRLQAYQRRLASLTLPAPLRSALAEALDPLREGSTEAATAALQRLVAPVRETIGRTVSDVVGAAARGARARPTRPPSPINEV